MVLTGLIFFTGKSPEKESVLTKTLERDGNDPEAAIRLLIALINLHFMGDEVKRSYYYSLARKFRAESGIKLDDVTENKWKFIRSRMENT